MDGLGYFFGAICFLVLSIAIPVAIARWIFRVNRQIAILEQIASDLKTLVTLEKMRKL